MKFTIWISVGKCRWHPSLVLRPFTLEGGESASGFLQIVNLLPIIRTPKVAIDPMSTILIVFDPLDDKIVFSKRADILPQRERVEVVDECIAHAQVIEVDFALLTKFLA